MRLYNLVIVEDEEKIRSGLEQYIDWHAMGFHVADTFPDGKSAMEYIKENSCDVVLTDIMMGIMTGLELIENLKEILPDIKVVILSGYNDFSYVRKALQYKVEDYLLKPIDDDELCIVFKKIKNQLDFEYKDDIGDFISEQEILNCDITSKSEMDVSQTIMFRFTTLMAALNSGDVVQIERVIDDMMEEIENFSTEEIYNLLKKIYCMIATEYAKRKIDVIQISNGRFNYNQLPYTPNYNEVATCLKESFVHLSKGLIEMKMDYGSDIVTYVMEYVERHISQDLGTDILASKCRVHPAYLSRIFKIRTGEKLVDYILRVKMKKAVELLKTGEYKVLDISEMLGYSSSAYFSVQFKKYTGYSPREYSVRILEK